MSEKKVLVIGIDLSPAYCMKYNRFGVIQNGEVVIKNLDKSSIQNYKNKTVIHDKFLDALIELQKNSLKVDFLDYIISYKNKYDIYYIYYSYADVNIVIASHMVPKNFEQIVSIIKKSELNKFFSRMKKVEKEIEEEKQELEEDEY